MSDLWNTWWIIFLLPNSFWWDLVSLLLKLLQGCWDQNLPEKWLCWQCLAAAWTGTGPWASCFRPRGIKHGQVPGLWEPEHGWPPAQSAGIQGFGHILPKGCVSLQKSSSSLLPTVPCAASAPCKARKCLLHCSHTSAFFCQSGLRLVSIFPKFFQRLKRNLPLTLSKVCASVFGKWLILKSANSS